MRTRLYSIIALFVFGILILPYQTQAQSRGDLTEELHETYDFSPEGRISLENINGDVQIRTWNRDEVKLDVVKSANSQERLDEAEVDIRASKNTIRIKTRYPDRRWSDSRDRRDRLARVDYTLTVPSTARLDEIDLINGDLDIEGVKGEVQASTINGRVHIEGLTNRTRLSTVNGDLDVTWQEIDRSTPVKISSVNGRLRLTLPSDTNARLKASTVHGAISNDFDLPVNRGRFIGRKLEGRIGDGDGRIDLNNVNGGITIRRANDGRTPSPTENLLRENRRNRDNDRDRDWDNDWGTFDWDDDWSDDMDSVMDIVQNVGGIVQEVVSGTMRALEDSGFDREVERAIEDHEIDSIRDEIRREIRRGMREARREVEHAKREINRAVNELDYEIDNER